RVFLDERPLLERELRSGRRRHAGDGGLEGLLFPCGEGLDGVRADVLEEGVEAVAAAIIGGLVEEVEVLLTLLDRPAAADGPQGEGILDLFLLRRRLGHEGERLGDAAGDLKIADELAQLSIDLAVPGRIPGIDALADALLPFVGGFG